jgi:hypothetical protein
MPTGMPTCLAVAQFEKDSYQGIASAMPTAAKAQAALSRCGLPATAAAEAGSALRAEYGMPEGMPRYESFLK